jgi:hypothetical protein
MNTHILSPQEVRERRQEQQADLLLSPDLDLAQKRTSEQKAQIITE